MQILNINDFVELTRKEPNKWIKYCEILLDDLGRVILLHGSHSTAMIKYASYRYNISSESLINDIGVDHCDPIEYIADKYNIIAIWYEGYIHGAKLTRFQKRSISILQKTNLINPDPIFNIESKEYRNCLLRHNFNK